MDKAQDTTYCTSRQRKSALKKGNPVYSTHTHTSWRLKGLYIKEGAGFHAPQEESSKQARRQKQAGLSQRRSPKERSSTTGRWQPFTSLNERRQGNILISPSREDCYCLEIFLGLRQDDFYSDMKLWNRSEKQEKGAEKTPTSDAVTEMHEVKQVWHTSDIL